MTHRLPDVETRMRRQPTLWDVAFAVRGTILPRIALHLLLISIVTAGAVLASTEHPGIFARFSGVPFTLIGIALSVFMSFRNNACYSRWWEARHLWGDLVIACRSIARQTSLLDPNSRAQILRGLCGFSAGLYSRLRRADEAHAIAPWWDIGKASQGPNPTDAVLQGIGLKLPIWLMREGSTRFSTRCWISSLPTWLVSKVGARGYSILRFHSRIRCCFTGLRSYSAQRFLLRWQEHWGGGPFYRCSLWRTRFLVSMRWAVSWRSHSVPRRTRSRSTQCRGRSRQS